MIAITEINQLFSLTTTIVGTLFAMYKFYSNYTTKNKIIDLTKLDVESCNFLTDPLKEFYKNEQRRNLFYEYTDIDASDEQQVLINELRLKLNVKLSWCQLKMASKYFEYNTEMITICIKKKEVWEARVLWIMSTILALVSFLLMCLSLFDPKITIQSVITYFIIGIISIVYIVFFAQRFCAPVYLAQCIEKQLKVVETKPRA